MLMTEPKAFHCSAFCDIHLRKELMCPFVSPITKLGGAVPASMGNTLQCSLRFLTKKNIGSSASLKAAGKRTSSWQFSV